MFALNIALGVVAGIAVLYVFWRQEVACKKEYAVYAVRNDGKVVPWNR